MRKELAWYALEFVQSLDPLSLLHALSFVSGFVALASDPKPRYGRYFARSGLNHHKLFNL
jgi:hypothetical protein